MCKTNSDGRLPSCIESKWDGPGCEDWELCHECADTMKKQLDAANLQLSDMTKDRDDWSAKETATSNRLVEALLEVESLKKEKKMAIGIWTAMVERERDDALRLYSELKERFDLYGQHLKSCVVHLFPEIPCDCHFLKDEVKRKCLHTRLSDVVYNGNKRPCLDCEEDVLTDQTSCCQSHTPGMSCCCGCHSQ